MILPFLNKNPHRIENSTLVHFGTVPSPVAVWKCFNLWFSYWHTIVVIVDDKTIADRVMSIILELSSNASGRNLYLCEVLVLCVSFNQKNDTSHGFETEFIGTLHQITIRLKLTQNIRIQPLQVFQWVGLFCSIYAYKVWPQLPKREF